jgi:hypothetical protein
LRGAVCASGVADAVMAIVILFNDWAGCSSIPSGAAGSTARPPNLGHVKEPSATASLFTNGRAISCAHMARAALPAGSRPALPAGSRLPGSAAVSFPLPLSLRSYPFRRAVRKSQSFSPIQVSFLSGEASDSSVMRALPSLQSSSPTNPAKMYVAIKHKSLCLLAFRCKPLPKLSRDFHGKFPIP